MGSAGEAEGAGLWGSPSDSLPPPRGKSHGAGDLPEAEGELPGLEECLAMLGCLLGQQHCHHQI